MVLNDQQIAGMDKAQRTALMNSITGYKPLNLLGTISANGRTNVCIVSSVFHMGSNPALLGMIMRPPRPNNDSLRNIRDTGVYTLNNVTVDHYREAHQTSASYPSGVSEFEQCGLEEYYHEDHKAPFVASSFIKIGLEVAQIIDIELNGTTLVIGKVVHVIINDNVVGEDGSIDHVIANSLAGSGLDGYFQPQLLDRLTYAKPDKPVKSLIEEDDH